MSKKIPGIEVIRLMLTSCYQKTKQILALPPPPPTESGRPPEITENWPPPKKNPGYAVGRTPLIRPPSESHWCGRITGMVAREGFIYFPLLQ